MGGGYFPSKWLGRSSPNTQFTKYDSRNKYLKMRDMFFSLLGMPHMLYKMYD